MRKVIMVTLALLASPLAAQDMSTFKTGPVFKQFGPHAPVEGIGQVPADTEFAVAFDVSKPAEAGEWNKGFESAARFINMHVAHGVPEDNIRIAVVVHGKAVNDLLARGDNPSADMVQIMIEHGVRFIVCGQSAAAYGVTQDQLIPGVEMALSAMTAHALLQQRGYTVNPF
ncbi:DsrE family protein [Qipengyuania soli]|nr:DsrE family protein [Qipengyuania soli]